jgi:16S rRNA (guanine(966)-N(2))-methyltransferase RsmD/pantetheine-phosphate adenylyltransferase
MRVIAGKYGGRRLTSPTNDDIRPTTDRAKENLFNILQNSLQDAVVVDLFSGSGALGIEALSRGAKKVYFCDSAGKSLALTKSNLSFVPIGDYEIIKGDFNDCLAKLNLRGIKADIVLCDPPYDLLLGGSILDRLSNLQLLNCGGKVIIEHYSYDKDISSEIYSLVDKRKYGDTSISFFQKVRKVAVTGSFDPFTKGHKDLVIRALEDFDKVYVVMLVNEEKITMYDVNERLNMIKLSLKEYKKRITIEFYGGLTVDYCKQNGIKYILRGIRTDNDLPYEKQIADYNFENGGIRTVFMPAIHSDIYSTLVRENVAENKPVKGLVEENIEEILIKKR